MNCEKESNFNLQEVLYTLFLFKIGSSALFPATFFSVCSFWINITSFPLIYDKFGSTSYVLTEAEYFNTLGTNLFYLRITFFIAKWFKMDASSNSKIQHTCPYRKPELPFPGWLLMNKRIFSFSLSWKILSIWNEVLPINRIPCEKWINNHSSRMQEHILYKITKK